MTGEAAKKTAKKTTKKKAGKKASGSSGGGKNLLVVESPAKAKTIKKILGRDFSIKASLGHVRDIPRRGRGKKAFGIDFENDYEPVYETIKDREKTVNELAAAAAKADAIYLAPDPDREGEAIAWHVREALREKADLPDEKFRRVTFNAITKNSVREAIENPRTINMDLVNAQQGRRVLDRLVGFSLSPFLWRKVTKGLSAGRVQSVAVRMVVEREREIAAFNPEEFWRVTAEYQSPEEGGLNFLAALVEWKGVAFELGQEVASTGESATAVVSALEAADHVVQSVTEKETKGRPSPPFITSTLQQSASSFLYFNTSRTMRLAQQLYEGIEIEQGQTGLITYMRTDSTRVAPEALASARDVIREQFGDNYLPEKAVNYRSKKSAQDAHEAIRPTDPTITPESIRGYLSDDQYKLYNLIWRRFIASQMKPAVYKTTTIRIGAADGILEAKGKVVVFDGHTAAGFSVSKRKAVQDKEKSEDGEEAVRLPSDDQILPALAEQDALTAESITPSQHFTQPPPRFSEASLVRALEKEGIGRPSTYAAIIKTIQDRGYVRQEKRRFFASELGMAVTDILMQNFPKIMDLKFTAGMEEDLDRVEEGDIDWHKLVDQFYKPFESELEDATENAEPLKGRPAPGGETCKECGEPMVVRYSQRGAFLGCSNYPDCKGTLPMPGEDGADGEEEGDPVECPKCNVAMTRRRSRFGEFYGCPNYPDCKETIAIGRDGKPVLPPKVEIDCDKCGTRMVVGSAGRGFQVSCPAEGCDNTKPLDREGKVVELPDIGEVACDQCGAPMTIRMSRRGPFVACTAYPKCRYALPLPKPGETMDDVRKAKAEGKGKKTAKKTAKKKTAKKKTTKKTSKKTDDAS